MTHQQAFGMEPVGSFSAGLPTILYFATCPRLPSYDCACERFRCVKSSTGAFPDWNWGIALCSPVTDPSGGPDRGGIKEKDHA